MMTNNPNANLIEAMKEKLPLKGQLADMLMVKYLSPYKSQPLFQENWEYR